ncbi:MAG TPA: HD domain-containing protein [Tenericutes bacterium]|nr:HD domain-containing protein [Mycoplasmatota bacterium]
MVEVFEKNMLRHEKILSAYASKDKDAIRLNEYKKDIRGNYFRDIDRIIHSLSYTRYIDKTQVFSNIENDHISKRIIHVQLVSKIARTIGRALCLNEDLIEAIALGHDVGHVPFGHVGERILNNLSIKYNQGYFKHNVQSVRNLMNIENAGKGINLTIQVLDGILCHNGEIMQDMYYPQTKNKTEFLKLYNKCYTTADNELNLIPMTLEGCVVRISDIIGYIGRDIEDAVRLGIIEKNAIPKKIKENLGDDNSSIVNTIIMDIIENSYEKPYIKISKPVYECISQLKNFNYAEIYNKANTSEKIKEYETMFEKVFLYYLEVLENERYEEPIYIVFLNDMTDEYKTNNTNERIVIDYIAGMTDDYFINEYNYICQKVHN